MSRRILIAGNWKLHHRVAASCELAKAVHDGVPEGAAVDVVVAPVFTALAKVDDALGVERRVSLAAQDCYWEDEGAHTGEVSPPLLKDVGCAFVIVGHSERRARFHDGDEQVRRKVEALLEHGLAPIVCVGETLEQRERGVTESVVLEQLGAALGDLGEDRMRHVVVAYEPVWAIGTGRVAEPEDAQDVHASIRGYLREAFGDETADRTRILYGGSVKPGNAAALLAQKDIDGALVGGASLKADSFLGIVRAALEL